MKWRIIKQFSRYHDYCFTFQDVIKKFPEKNHTHLSRILSDMVSIGMLYKIDHAIYHIIPLHADPSSYQPNGFQLSKYLMKNKDYYIGYGSALEVHGLALPSVEEQSEKKEYIVTSMPVRTYTKAIGNTECRFIPHADDQFYGFSPLWITRIEKAMVSDLEKTLVDLHANPKYCRGIPEIAYAFFQARTRINYDRLFYYFERNSSKTAKKRFLYLTHILGMRWTRMHDKLMTDLGTSFALLDPTVANQGKTSSRFKLKINLDPEIIRNQITQ